MSSSAGSTPPSGSGAKPVARAALVTHGRQEQIGDGIARVLEVAGAAGVELIFAPDEAARHGLEASGDPGDAELVVVLGGDGTMLRALRTYLGSGIPVIGVNFGRVGFLSSMQPEELEVGLTRAFRGELEVVELPTLEVENSETGHVAVNDLVVTSAVLGRMVELEWSIGGEDFGRVPCDGLICSTPSGSTAYNLSNGGPVLMWGLDAMALTFVAPHDLRARPFVLPRGHDLHIWNRTPDVGCAVLVDGHRVGDAGSNEQVLIRLGEQRSLLGTLPEATFVRRYRQSFGST